MLWLLSSPATLLSSSSVSFVFVCLCSESDIFLQTSWGGCISALSVWGAHTEPQPHTHPHLQPQENRGVAAPVLHQKATKQQQHVSSIMHQNLASRFGPLFHFRGFVLSFSYSSRSYYWTICWKGSNKQPIFPILAMCGLTIQVF